MICIDTHLHFYEFYDPGTFLESLLLNLDAAEAGCAKAGVVLDREGQNAFQLLRERAASLDQIDIDLHDDYLACAKRGLSARIYRGVQFACAEGFEILGLFCSASAEDGISAPDAIARIKASGGAPVLAWAPGKWMFRRRERVDSLLDELEPSQIYLGDTSLRPCCWGEPSAMASFRARGGKILCGSDPLPFSGQEKVAGSYASKLNADAATGVGMQIQRCLSSDQLGLGFIGRRSSALSFISRMVRSRLARNH